MFTTAVQKNVHTNRIAFDVGQRLKPTLYRWYKELALVEHMLVRRKLINIAIKKYALPQKVFRLTWRSHCQQPKNVHGDDWNRTTEDVEYGDPHQCSRWDGKEKGEQVGQWKWGPAIQSENEKYHAPVCSELVDSKYNKYDLQDISSSMVGLGLTEAGELQSISWWNTLIQQTTRLVGVAVICIALNYWSRDKRKFLILGIKLTRKQPATIEYTNEITLLVLSCIIRTQA